MQVLLRSILAAQGANVDVAENGLVAIESAMTNPYDVILMDLQMPILDGYSAVSRQRELNYSGPVIALTAHAMAGEADRCIAAGFTDYLAKPVDRQQLFTLIKLYGKNIRAGTKIRESVVH